MTRQSRRSGENQTSTAKEPGRYFFDCEFNEKARQGSRDQAFYDIDFISIAVVKENGDIYYAVNKDFDQARAQDNAWLVKHVLSKLPPESEWKSIDQIRQELIDFFDVDDGIELWARNKAYDVVSFCRLFGSMMSMYDAFNEKGIQRVAFRDINELAYDPDIDTSALAKKDESKAHAADYDANFERLLYQQIMRQKAQKKTVPKP